jgi:RecJ-like exonuclease
VEEKVLLRLALACSLLGLGVVWFMGQASVPISEIGLDMVDQSVKISGVVSSVEIFDSFDIVRVYDSTGAIDCLSFDTEYFLGQEVVLRGKVSEYEESVQIILS